MVWNVAVRSPGARRGRGGRPAAEQLSRGDYAELGLRLLAEGGISSVTIATCCERLGVTKGSFYYHFDGVAALHLAMLERWEHEYGRVRPGMVVDLPPLERLDAIVEAAIVREHEVESALRAWSRTDPAAAAVQARLDELRVEFVGNTIAACGVPVERAFVLARMGLAVLIGYQAMSAPVDRVALRAAAAEWRAHLQGVVAEAPGSKVRAARRRTGPAA